MQKIKTQYELTDFLLRNLTGHHVSSMEKIVLCSISSFVNPDNNWVGWPSIDTLMLLSCATRPTIVKATKGLKDKGFLQWEKGRTNVSNRYYIDLSVIGKSIGKPAMYSKNNRKDEGEDYEDAPF